MVRVVRVGTLVLDLDNCAIESVATLHGSHGICVYIQGRIFGPYPEQSDAYAALKKYTDHTEALENYNLRVIREESLDPWADDLPRTLFSVFQQIPGSDELVLRLYADGSGGMWNVNQTEQLVTTALCHWHTCDNGLERLQDYKRTVQATHVPVMSPGDLLEDLP